MLPDAAARPEATLHPHLGGVGRQHVELVDSQTQLAQVDVEVDHHISRHGRREHFLTETETERDVRPAGTHAHLSPSRPVVLKTLN